MAKLIFNHQRLATANDSRFGEPDLPTEIAPWILGNLSNAPGGIAVCLTSAPPDHRAAGLVGISSFRNPQMACALVMHKGLGFYLHWDHPKYTSMTAESESAYFCEVAPAIRIDHVPVTKTQLVPALANPERLEPAWRHDADYVDLIRRRSRRV